MTEEYDMGSEIAVGRTKAQVVLNTEAWLVGACVYVRVF